MNLYLISQNEDNDYDTYDSAVVAAPSEDAARNTHPNGRDEPWEKYDGWCSCPELVNVELIGTALEGTKAGVICSSFNAG